MVEVTEVPSCGLVLLVNQTSLNGSVGHANNLLKFCPGVTSHLLKFVSY